jgi:hypothetical protein
MGERGMEVWGTPTDHYIPSTSKSPWYTGVHTRAHLSVTRAPQSLDHLGLGQCRQLLVGGWGGGVTHSRGDNHEMCVCVCVCVCGWQQETAGLLHMTCVQALEGLQA